MPTRQFLRTRCTIGSTAFCVTPYIDCVLGLHMPEPALLACQLSNHTLPHTYRVSYPHQQSSVLCTRCPLQQVLACSAPRTLPGSGTVGSSCPHQQAYPCSLPATQLLTNPLKHHSRSTCCLYTHVCHRRMLGRSPPIRLAFSKQCAPCTRCQLKPRTPHMRPSQPFTAMERLHSACSIRTTAAAPPAPTQRVWCLSPELSQVTLST